MEYCSVIKQQITNYNFDSQNNKGESQNNSK